MRLPAAALFALAAGTACGVGRALPQLAPRTMLRVVLPGKVVRDEWSRRYAAMPVHPRATEAVPAFSGLRRAFQRIAEHLGAIAGSGGSGAIWLHLLERALEEPVESLEVVLRWRVAPLGSVHSASDSLLLAAGWIGVRPESQREILALFSSHDLEDQDPDVDRVVLPLERGVVHGTSPVLGWSSPDEVWFALGRNALDEMLSARAAARSSPDASAEESGASLSVRVDLAQWEAWFSHAFFGQAPSAEVPPRVVSIEKLLLDDVARDRLAFPITAPSASADVRRSPAYEVRAGWLRLAMGPELSESAFSIAALFVAAQARRVGWISDVHALRAAKREEPPAACGVVCFAPAMSNLSLRPAFWFASQPPSAAELRAAGFELRDRFWVKSREGDSTFVVAREDYWVAGADANDVLELDAAVAPRERIPQDDSWLGSASFETFELYSALRLALLARRSSLPEWARSWIEGLPSPRDCGSILGDARWNVRAEGGRVVLEGDGALGDPLLTTVELLLSKAAARALDLWLREIAEPEHAASTRGAVRAAVDAARRAWLAEPTRDLAAPRAAEELVELRWTSPMEPDPERGPSLILAHRDGMPPLLRSELGFTGDAEECPWVVFEAHPWFQGGRQRYVGASPSGTVRVLSTEETLRPAQSGR